MVIWFGRNCRLRRIKSQLILALTVAQLAVYVKCAFYNMYLHTEASNVAFVGRSPLATVALDE